MQNPKSIQGKLKSDVKGGRERERSNAEKRLQWDFEIFDFKYHFCIFNIGDTTVILYESLLPMSSLNSDSQT